MAKRPKKPTHAPSPLMPEKEIVNTPIKADMNAKRSELPTDNREWLLNLYISEYGMVTTRCTYWMTIHFGLLPVVAVLIAIVAQVWSSPINHALLIWGCVITLHLITLLWSFVLSEYYRAVYYVEVELRSLVKHIVQEGKFWQYEPYLARTRKRSALQWEYPIPALMFLIIIFAAINRTTFSREDIIGVIINIPLFIFLIRNTRTAANIRRNFQKQIEETPVPPVEDDGRS